MFLKRVTLSGFKSFADRVDFDFGRGVTCIVGPNGCGKSNVLDAFKWVLGEQSARSLRGKHMTDMIFNGSSTRKSSGVAQVELVFGNDDRALDMDLDEVVVSRKLYRSGESEYLLNDHVSRLKDIRELFLDTGVGVDAYSVIEQGRVDALLQSSPAERRTIFEEAAGISKYKARKKEAQRKLERTEQNLLRVEDIVEELERRLRSVKLQAGKARSFREYEARLNDLRSAFVMAEYHRLTESYDAKRREIDRHADRVTELKTEVDRLEAEDARDKVALDELGNQISQVDNRLVQARSELSGRQERVEAAAQRIEEQQAQAERTRSRIEADVNRRQESAQRLEEAEAQVASLERESEAHHEKIAGLTDKEGNLAASLAQVQAVLEDEKAAILDVLRRNGQAHNEIVRLNSHRESLIEQKGRLARRDAEIVEELSRQQAGRSEADTELREVASNLESLEAALEANKQEVARIDGVRQELVDELAARKERRSALMSRSELLEDLQKRMDGIGEGVRQWLALTDDRQESPDALERHWRSEGEIEEDVEAPTPEPAFRLVADLIEADIDHARIIETVLGDRDQCLVIDSRQAFRRHFDSVGELAGRATVLTLDHLPPVVNERDFSSAPGFVARARDLVRLPEKYDSVGRHLFAKTIVVRDLDTAMTLSNDDTTGHRFVTVEGEVVEPDGRISFGPSHRGAGMISRRSELREIEHELERIDRDVEALNARLGATRARAGDLERQQHELRSRVVEANTAQAVLKARIGKISETIERYEGERPLIEGEVNMIDRQVEEVLAKCEQASALAEALERENEERETRAAAHQAQIESIVIERSEVQHALTEAKVNAGQIAEKRAAASQSLSGLRRLLSELDEALEHARHELEQCAARVEDAKRTIESGREDIARLEDELTQWQTESAALRQEREELRMGVEARGRAIKASREALSESESAHHQCDMAVAETKVRREELVNRVREELDIDLPAKFETYVHEDHDWSAIEEEINELRQKMARLGNVNLDAIDELAELEERHGFLTGQRDDLTESRKQLEQLIEKLDGESRTRFDEAFKIIRDNFRNLFRKLFGGGKADVVLEDPENPLDTGIEIVARPPGKELQIISLMSGGEKSMTAIALLMSIFKFRPAPFVILDEVDAALDEANNERFNLIVNEFNDTSQFIVITHSKRTMSIAEQLYGITMQEPGVSTRVSVQLHEHVA